jgi:hypothetical protein
LYEFCVILLRYLFKKENDLNRFNWTYLADQGKKHHVGLMHGAESGHLLVYCDAKIILIDFEILEDKTYSFFIDEQLCEISIEKIDGQFYYSFEINKTADTPRNNLRKKIERRHVLQGLLLLGGILLLTVTFSLIMINRNNDENEMIFPSEMAQRGKEGKAKILKVSDSEIKYFYIVNGQSYSAETDFDDKSVVILETGMPLEEGDEFVVKYVSNNPKLNEIDYSRPTKIQIAKYYQRAIKKHLEYNPQKDSIFSACFVDIAYDLKGIQGLADIFFQNASEEENPHNNTNTYKRLVRDIPFQQEMNKRCWN